MARIKDSPDMLARYKVALSLHEAGSTYASISEHFCVTKETAKTYVANARKMDRPYGYGAAAYQWVAQCHA